MDIFGSRWHDHERRLEENWRQLVSDEDTVLIPGDISWAMQLQKPCPTCGSSNRLPGRKSCPAATTTIGGHRWPRWSSSAGEKLEFPHLSAQQQLAGRPDWIICGTRGWILPDDPDFRAGDEKIYLREAGRLRLSLEAAAPLRPAGRTGRLPAFSAFRRDGPPNLVHRLAGRIPSTAAYSAISTACSRSAAIMTGPRRIR